MTEQAQDSDKKTPPRKATTGVVVSLISAITFTIAIVVALLLSVFTASEGAELFTGGAWGFLFGGPFFLGAVYLFVAAILGLVPVTLIYVGTILAGMGKTRAGGALVIVFGLLGLPIALPLLLVPSVLAVVGGVLVLNKK